MPTHACTGQEAVEALQKVVNYTKAQRFPKGAGDVPLRLKSVSLERPLHSGYPGIPTDHDPFPSF